MVGKQLLASVRKQREKVASDFSSCEDRKSFYERINSQLKQVFNQIIEKQAARKLKMRHALQDVQRTFQRIAKVNKVNRAGLLDNWKWPVKAIKEKFHQAAVKLNSSQLLQIVLENFKKRKGKIF